jgi:hypothetical protein
MNIITPTSTAIMPTTAATDLPYGSKVVNGGHLDRQTSDSISLPV